VSKEDKAILNTAKSWIERFVIGLDICPFAKHVPQSKIRYTIFEQDDLLSVLENIQFEFQHLLSLRAIHGRS